MNAFREILKYLNVDLIQFGALVLGIAEVLLARANNVWLYPTGIAAVILSIFSLLEAHLYADCLLHVYYLVMSIYGWVYWTSKKDGDGVKVTFSNKQDWTIAIAISFGGWAVLYVFLITLTPSETPIWDAWVSAWGWSGMWLLARRKVENWLFLNVSNAFAIPLLIHKDLNMLAILTAFLFIVACKGYFDWRKIAKPI